MHDRQELWAAPSRGGDRSEQNAARHHHWGRRNHQAGPSNSEHGPNYLELRCALRVEAGFPALYESSLCQRSEGLNREVNEAMRQDLASSDQNQWCIPSWQNRKVFPKQLITSWLGPKGWNHVTGLQLWCSPRDCEVVQNNLQAPECRGSQPVKAPRKIHRAPKWRGARRPEHLHQMSPMGYPEAWSGKMWKANSAKFVNTDANKCRQS